jgi:hypothetical protein
MSRDGEAVKFRRIISGPHDDLYSLEQGMQPPNQHHKHILPNSEKKQLLPKGSVALPVLIIIWYTTAAIAITTSKKVMTMLALPFMLCTSQFVVASIVVGLYARLFRKYVPMQANSRAILFKISYSYTFGFVFTNTAFSLGKPNLLCFPSAHAFLHFLLSFKTCRQSFLNKSAFFVIRLIL